MNMKKMNYLLVILNVITIVIFYVLAFGNEYFGLFGIMSGIGDTAKSVYNSFIIEFFANNLQTIINLVFGGLGIFNIICGITNRKYKKLCFWQFINGIYLIWNIIPEKYDDATLIMNGLFGIILILFMIKNILFIYKNRTKKIQIILFILVIIYFIFYCLDNESLFLNSSIIEILILSIVQAIYINRQDEDLEESKIKKYIIVLYILQMIIVIIFLGMIIAYFMITKINDNKKEKEIGKLYDNIAILQGATIKDLYIPVEKDYKYGFIRESGEEKIGCEYDRVSFFFEIKIKENTYYIALAEKNNEYYIVSKTNDSIRIKDFLENYLRKVDDYMWKEVTDNFNQYGSYGTSYVTTFSHFFEIFLYINDETNEVKIQEKDYYDYYNDCRQEIILEEKMVLNETNGKYYNKYYYSSMLYDMTIEPIYDEIEWNNSNGDNELKNMQYNVTINKKNGETQSNIVYLPGIDEEEKTLEVLNGYVEFENEDETQKGLYDMYGNQIKIHYDYYDSIVYIEEDKIILEENNDDENYDINAPIEEKYTILDMTGKILLQKTVLSIYDDVYLVKSNAQNDNGRRMILMDKALNIISNEYDKIITNVGVDLTEIYSSYY